jgi:hypothetical protein
MNKPYNIQNTNICNGIFHISFFKALLINEGETTRGEREYGRNDSEQDSGQNDPVPAEDTEQNLNAINDHMMNFMMFYW